MIIEANKVIVIKAIPTNNNWYKSFKGFILPKEEDIYTTEKYQSIFSKRNRWEFLTKIQLGENKNYEINPLFTIEKNNIYRIHNRYVKVKKIIIEEDKRALFIKVHDLLLEKEIIMKINYLRERKKVIISERMKSNINKKRETYLLKKKELENNLNNMINKKVSFSNSFKPTNIINSYSVERK